VKNPDLDIQGFQGLSDQKQVIKEKKKDETKRSNMGNNFNQS
jgi:hypothetical protein